MAGELLWIHGSIEEIVSENTQERQREFIVYALAPLAERARIVCMRGGNDALLVEQRQMSYEDVGG